MKATIYGVRRRTTGGPVEVETAGGWVAWTLCSPTIKDHCVAVPGVSAAIDDDKPFLIKFSDQPQDETPPPPPPKYQGDDDYEADDAQDGDASEGDESDSESESDESQGDGQGGGGEPPEFFVLMDDEEGHRVDVEGAPIVGGMIQGAVAEVLTEAKKAIAEAVVTVAHDSVVYVNSSIAKLDARMEEIAKRAAEAGGAVVKIEVKSPVKVSFKDGLFHNQFPKLVKYVAAGNNVFLPGPPGTGKSHAAEQAAATLGWQFGSISLGPTTPESRLWGGMDAHGNFHEPAFVRLARFAQDNPESGAVMCLDEMDNGHAGILATLNSAMANGWFTAPNGDIVRWGNNFTIVAAANTFGTGPTSEFSGRNRLDAATLDRFLYLPWDTDLKMEKVLVHAHLNEHPKGKFIADDWLKVWGTARKNVETHGLKVFVTMRGAINGSKLLAQDVPVKEVFSAVLGNKLPADQLKKVNPF